MSEEGFLRRWSRLKAGEGVGAPVPPPEAPPELAPLAQTAPHPAVAPAPAAQPARELPTLEDVARLTPDSDFSAFVTQGVDKNVQRLALKKLFSDPHFNVMDGLDIYIDDYNRPDPVSATMLAALHHSQSMFAQAQKDEQARLNREAPPALEDVAGAPAAGDRADGELAAGDPADGEPAVGEPAAGELAAGDPAAGDPAVGEPAAGTLPRDTTNDPEQLGPMTVFPAAAVLAPGAPASGPPANGSVATGSHDEPKDNAARQSHSRGNE
jgi:hypothetical protein